MTVIKLLLELCNGIWCVTATDEFGTICQASHENRKLAVERCKGKAQDRVDDEDLEFREERVQS